MRIPITLFYSQPKSKEVKYLDLICNILLSSVEGHQCWWQTLSTDVDDQRLSVASDGASVRHSALSRRPENQLFSNGEKLKNSSDGVYVITRLLCKIID